MDLKDDLTKYGMTVHRGKGFYFSLVDFSIVHPTVPLRVRSKCRYYAYF